MIHHTQMRLLLSVFGVMLLRLVSYGGQPSVPTKICVKVAKKNKHLFWEGFSSYTDTEHVSVCLTC